jgi:AcrR family transcriptional regulator
VSVGEIARQAGVDRAILFRTFPTKQNLIAAIVAQRMYDAARAGHEFPGHADPDDAVFQFTNVVTGTKRADRVLADAVVGESPVRPDVRQALVQLIEGLTRCSLLGRRQHRPCRSGRVRRRGDPR